MVMGYFLGLEGSIDEATAVAAIVIFKDVIRDGSRRDAIVLIA